MSVTNKKRRMRYFITNPSENTVTVIDGFYNTVVKTYDVGGNSLGITAAEDDNIYTASADNSIVTIIHSEGNSEVIENIPNDGYIAVDNILGRFYVTSQGKLEVYDIASGVKIVSIPGLSIPGYLTLNNCKKELFVIDKNIVKVFSTATLELVDTISIFSRANYIVISPDDTTVYISYGSSGTMAGIQVYNITKGNLVTNITTAQLSNPAGMVLRKNILYVANNTAVGTIIPIDITRYNVFTDSIITVGTNPVRLILSPDKTKLYVVNNTSGTTAIVDLTDDLPMIESTIALPPGSFGITASIVSTEVLAEIASTYEIKDIKQSVYIMAKKVFAHCQQRIGFPMVVIPIPEGQGSVIFDSIIFKSGSRVPGTTIITPLPDRPNYSRVQTKIAIPYTAILRNSKGEPVMVDGVLPDIDKDVVMFIPQTRDEFVFDILVETRSEQLNTASVQKDGIKLAVGIFLILRVVGEVQLLLPCFGYSLQPPECEEYEPVKEADVCKTFLDTSATPFPEDFFPPYFEDFKIE